MPSESPDLIDYDAVDEDVAHRFPRTLAALARPTPGTERRCYECGESQLLGPICAVCNPEIAHAIDPHRYPAAVELPEGVVEALAEALRQAGTALFPFARLCEPTGGEEGRPSPLDASLADTDGVEEFTISSAFGRGLGFIYADDFRAAKAANDAVEAALAALSRESGWRAAMPDVATHQYEPHFKFPWFCGHCGYPEHERLKHTPSVAAPSAAGGGANQGEADGD